MDDRVFTCAHCGPSSHVQEDFATDGTGSRVRQALKNLSLEGVQSVVHEMSQRQSADLEKPAAMISYNVGG